jgi:hypothetical protein
VAADSLREDGGHGASRQEGQKVGKDLLPAVSGGKAGAVKVAQTDGGDQGVAVQLPKGKLSAAEGGVLHIQTVMGADVIVIGQNGQNGVGSKIIGDDLVPVAVQHVTLRHALHLHVCIGIDHTVMGGSRGGGGIHRADGIDEFAENGLARLPHFLRGGAQGCGEGVGSVLISRQHTQRVVLRKLLALDVSGRAPTGALAGVQNSGDQIVLRVG